MNPEIDIQQMAFSCGASLETRHYFSNIEWWRFSPDELQLFVEKIQQAEREKYAELLEYIQHDSWRCGYHDECRCGLNKLLESFGLDPVPLPEKPHHE